METPLDPQFILINKPAGWTSFDVVAYIRNRARQQCHPFDRLRAGSKQSEESSSSQSDSSATPQNDSKKKPRIKVGHAGTLDPFATGLLILGVGREATKRLDEFKKLRKTYVATIHLGAVSDTYDGTGQIYRNPYPITHNPNDPTINSGTGYGLWDTEIPTGEQTVEVLKNFVGKQAQIPPMFSAKSINGVRLHKLARQGKVVERQPSEIEIYNISLLEYDWPLLKIEVECSTGTYIRSLAHDIGQKLGVGAYCEALERTRIGEFKLENALGIDKITKKM
ncbi:MAG: tRNA pseudouridine(55) synthase TruB [Candidatus Magasanikbacteria bacterium]|nr:tRNA pseudouridine(55) synthase TruB [Candidatus Magasanikbacteria bacterium]